MNDRTALPNSPQRSLAASAFDHERRKFLAALQRFSGELGIRPADVLAEVEATYAAMNGILAASDAA